MIDSGLNTYEEIAFNHLMPWMNSGYENDRYREILRFVDHENHKDSRQFFANLLEAHQSLKLPLSSELQQEWNMFTGLSQSKVHFVLADLLSAYHHASPKVRFYILLSFHAGQSLLSHVNLAIEQNSGTSFQKRLVSRTLARIEACLQMQTAGKSEDCDELLVIKILNLALVAIYLELYTRYKSCIETRNLQISKGRMHELLTEIHISDSMLGKIAQSLVDRYKIYFAGPEASQKTKAGAQKAETQANTADDFERLIQLVTERQKNMSDDPGKKESKAPEPIGAQNDSENIKNTTPATRIIGSGEVRKMLGISSGTLKKYRDNDLVPFSRTNPNGKISYWQHDIQKLLDSNKKKTSNIV
jgi:hypothetical protein